MVLSGLFGAWRVIPAVAEDAAGAAGHQFILSGQSNMTGDLERGFREKVTAAYQADQVTIVRSMKSGRGIRFWVADYGAPAGSVDDAVTGAKPSENGSQYPILLEAVRKAGDARKFKTVTLVWMQGESDAIKGRADLYEESFQRLQQRLMDDLGLETMNVVIGRISDYGLRGDKAEGWRGMREAQERLAKTLKHAAWVDTDDLNDVEGKPDGDLHYPKESSVVLGQRLAEKAIGLLGN